MKLTKKLCVLLSASITLSASLAHADIYGTLSPDDQAKIDHDQQVTPDPVAVDGSVWPRVTVYQRVNATPDQAASVMFDYPLQKTMFGPVLDGSGRVSKPGITSAVPVSPGSANTDIDYSMTFPKVLGIGLPDESYRVNDVLSAYGNGSYKISWTFVKATSMKDTSGVVQFEPLPGGYTLIGYTNLISPPRPPLAKLIVKMYVQQILDTVTSLVGQIQAEKNGDLNKLNSQVTALASALKH